MLKNLILFFFITTQFAFAQEKTIPQNQITAIKDAYNWTEEEYIIINYRFPKDYCSYENYGELEKSYTWLTNKVYTKVNPENHRNIFVYADKLAAKKILDNKTHYDDIGFYFLKNFFDKKGNCYGVLIINKNGQYKYILGEYSYIDIQNITDSLK